MLMALCATTVFAEFENISPGANGYDWTGYSNREKHICAIMIAVVLNLEKAPHTPIRIFRALNLFYDRAIYELRKDPQNANAEEALHLTCIEVIQLGRIHQANKAVRAL